MTAHPTAEPAARAPGLQHDPGHGAPHAPGNPTAHAPGRPSGAAEGIDGYGRAFGVPAAAVLVVLTLFAVPGSRLAAGATGHGRHH